MITAAHLNRLQRERELAHLSLPELLLCTGAMAGPYRNINRMEIRMQYMHALWHDLKLSIGTGMMQWRYLRRHLRHGGCPDHQPF